jgi:hypothetical protein
MCVWFESPSRVEINKFYSRATIRARASRKCGLAGSRPERNTSLEAACEREEILNVRRTETNAPPSQPPTGILLKNAYCLCETRRLLRAEEKSKRRKLFAGHTFVAPAVRSRQLHRRENCAFLADASGSEKERETVADNIFTLINLSLYWWSNHFPSGLFCLSRQQTHTQPTFTIG